MSHPWINYSDRVEDDIFYRKVSAEEFYLILRGGDPSYTDTDSEFSVADITVRNLHVTDSISLGNDIIVDKSTCLEDCYFRGLLSFEGATFHKEVYFEGCYFDNWILFKDAHFHASLKLTNIHCRSTLWIQGGIFQEVLLSFYDLRGCFDLGG